MQALWLIRPFLSHPLIYIWWCDFMLWLCLCKAVNLGGLVLLVLFMQTCMVWVARCVYAKLREFSFTAMWWEWNIYSLMVLVLLACSPTICFPLSSLKINMKIALHIQKYKLYKCVIPSRNFHLDCALLFKDRRNIIYVVFGRCKRKKTRQTTGIAVAKKSSGTFPSE